MFKDTFKPLLKAIAQRILPFKIRQNLRRVMNIANNSRTNISLARLRKKLRTKKPNSLVQCINYTVLINDGPNYYTLYKYIVINRIYHFKAQRPDPLILDCGSNIGMSILYSKHTYPLARVIGFEPDPALFPYLHENVARNKLKDVQLVQAALSPQEGNMTFYSDGKHGSYLAEYVPGDIPEGWVEYKVPCVRLLDYLIEPIDFLKMNIEGAEWEVLADSESCLRQVREMVIEYHHLPGLPRTLHRILELLHRQGLEYLINSFDSKTNPGVGTPFCLYPNSRYYLLIYSRRIDRIAAPGGTENAKLV